MVQTRVSQIPLLTGLRSIAGQYQALLCDVWGVLHNGVEAHAGVVDALRTFRGQGKTVLLLSNAPRPSGDIRPQLTRLGIPQEAYDDILTSGDATAALLADAPHGRACYHIGPERDLPLFEGLSLERVEPNRAEFVVCSGLFNDDNETPEDYRERLAALAERKLPMICANPDIVVERGAHKIYCAGALAALYGDLGGEVTYLGKPHAPIYDRARASLARLRGQDIADAEILAIGDGAPTDIAGANGQGIDALFITGGIAWPACGPAPDQPDADQVRAFCETSGVRPLAAMARLVW